MKSSGKESQNQALKMATGDIVIFSDAPTTYRKDAIRMIVRNYHDPSVGAVSGRYEYVNPTGAPVGLGTILFWKYENFLKSRQTKIKTVTGCCGCIYSVRRLLYENLPKDIISDLVEPLKIWKRDAVAFEPEGRLRDDHGSSKQEFGMRIRVFGACTVYSTCESTNPFKFGFVSFNCFP
jgi:cellulose synthase/poly-beta-1,6-N-acetylglucosamine synthase-like glycosyltransferase